MKTKLFERANVSIHREAVDFMGASSESQILVIP